LHQPIIGSINRWTRWLTRHRGVGRDAAFSRGGEEVALAAARVGGEEPGPQPVPLPQPVEHCDGVGPLGPSAGLVDRDRHTQPAGRVGQHVHPVAQARFATA
jgi:hypothetical protein